MSSERLYISITDLQNIHVQTKECPTSHSLRISISCTHENIEYGIDKDISKKVFSGYTDFIAMQNRERIIRDTVSECLEKICIQIQQKIGPFRMALREAAKKIESSDYVKLFTEK